MNIEFLEKTAISGDLVHSSFLCSTNYRINDILAQTDKDIAVFALSKLADCLLALSSVGIAPTVVCNSNPGMTGKRVFGYTVVNTWDLLANKDSYYFIIPITNDNTRSSIMRQLILNGVKQFSFVHNVLLPDFSTTGFGERLEKALLQAIDHHVDYWTTDGFWISKGFWHFVNGSAWWNRIIEWIEEDVERSADTRMLDIGPGIGLFSSLVKLLKNTRIDWINIDASFITDIAEKVIIANIETDDIEITDKYDIIVMTEVIEHFSYNPVPTLKKIGNYLAPNGRFYLSCPQWHRLYSYKSWRDMPLPGTPLQLDYHDHIYEFSRDELYEICVEAGFDVIREGFSGQGNTNFALGLAER
jgi:SAM-dependent methyltransferase